MKWSLREGNETNLSKTIVIYFDELQPEFMFLFMIPIFESVTLEIVSKEIPRIASIDELSFIEFLVTGVEQHFSIFQ
jgi:hypothetical protein